METGTATEMESVTFSEVTSVPSTSKFGEESAAKKHMMSTPYSKPVPLFVATESSVTEATS